MSFATNPYDNVSDKYNVNVRERQRISFSAVANAGSLILAWLGSAFTALGYSQINAANIQSRLRSIEGLEEVVVTADGDDFLVEFLGVPYNAAMLVDDGSDLVSVAGDAAQAEVPFGGDAGTLALTKVRESDEDNGKIFKIVLTQESNPADQIIAIFSQDEEGINLALKANSGENNSGEAIRFNLSRITELINTGAIAGLNLVLQDPDNLRELQTAVGTSSELLVASTYSGLFAGGETEVTADVIITEEVKGRGN